ncbi:MAG TPA: NUDIX hydrolase [Candidatus Saccharimonadales bacterium]
MLKTIEDSFEYGGRTIEIEYRDDDSFEDIPSNETHQVYGLCFLDGKVAIVEYEKDKPNLPGGKIDAGESWQDGFRREIDEELSMEVIDMSPIGYQFATNIEENKKYQLRVVATIRPKTEQTPDPAGTVTGFKFIEPNEVNKLIDYGPVGERMVERALEKLPTLKS